VPPAVRPGAATELRDLLDARITASRRNGHVVECALARLQSFFYRMNAKDNHQRAADCRL